MSRSFYVYILANVRGHRPVLYTGVTNDMRRRVAEHRIGLSGFTGRYSVTRLVYVECTGEVRAAIAREKQIKGWTRAKKIALIEAANPTWRDLLPEQSEGSLSAPAARQEADGGGQAGDAAECGTLGILRWRSG